MLSKVGLEERKTDAEVQGCLGREWRRSRPTEGLMASGGRSREIEAVNRIEGG